MTPDVPVREVLAQMAAKHIGCVLIEENAKLLGVFSERDALNKVSLDQKNLTRPVADFMTVSPATATKSDSIGFVLQAMDLGGYRHLPIVNSANIAVGIISSRATSLRAFLVGQVCRFPRANLTKSLGWSVST